MASIKRLTYLGQEMQLFLVFQDKLNVIGPHELTGSGSVRRCRLVGVGVALLAEVCVEMGFEVYAQAMPSVT